ncbi:MAG: hypothetical protein KF911_15845 [Pseudomonadales bacterium]|nr:hypothetical protein [Pseudomonadales bacterium]
MTEPVWRTTAWLVVVCLWLTGCGTARVSVPQQFPVPLVERIPLAMGVELNEALKTWAHTEKLESGREWQIELGSAQEPLFRSLLTGMFDRMTVLEGTPIGDAAVDGVLVPAIEELQFSTPDQTRTEYFEVWIRYRFQLLDRNGTLVAEWPLTAYGQSNARNFGGMQGQEPALQAAALAACRDAMAFFIVQFHQIPAVQTWLTAQQGARS